MTSERADAISAYIEKHYPCQEIPHGALKEIGDKFGVTRERVRQIRVKMGYGQWYARDHKPQKFCACGAPLSGPAKRCVDCRVVSLVCDICGVTFRKRFEEVITSAKNERYTSGKFFCSRKCFYSGGTVGAPGKPRERARQPICKRGHVKAEVGTYGYNCRACSLAYSREKYAARKAMAEAS